MTVGRVLLDPAVLTRDMKFAKAHAYGNDFLYVHAGDVQEADRVRVAREMCDRHTGVGADGLIFYEREGDSASMVLLNADGSRAEVSGNGLRGLAALLLEDDPRQTVTIAIGTEAGGKTLTRVNRSGSRQTFRAAMGTPIGLRKMVVDAAGQSVSAVLLNIGNPQCVLLGALPDDRRFRKLGAALERHALFPEGTNVEFAHVASPDCVHILIWERGVGPTQSSGTGSCAALVAAAAYGGAARDAEVVAPGGTQRVEWLDEGVFLTGWAEVLCEGEWVRQDRQSMGDS